MFKPFRRSPLQKESLKSLWLLAALSVFLLLMVIHQITTSAGEQTFKVYQANGDYESIEALTSEQGDAVLKASSKPILKPTFKQLPTTISTLATSPRLG
jgi:hypothetical protein